MKKIISTLCMALVAVAMMAQQPVITFEKTEHDFGKINESDGRVSTVFTFKNQGMAPLVLTNVRASCGCTTPTWTKEPVEPGQTGSITVTYNPNGRPGKFSKTITITSNATEATKKVYIKGEVIPKPAKPVNKYTIAVGELSMQNKVVNLGDIKKGEVRTSELEYANLTQAEHVVELAINSADGALLSQTTLSPIKPNETGKFVLGIDSKKTKLYGPIEVYAYVVVDGKKDISEPFKLTIQANIVEDFSQLSEEDRLLAPKMVTDGVVELGHIAKGKVLKGQLSLLNVGVNPLQVRRVTSNDKGIVLKPVKAVKSGKKGAIQLEINTANLEGGGAKYTRQVTIITNDPQMPQKTVTVVWVVD